MNTQNQKTEPSAENSDKKPKISSVKVILCSIVCFALLIAVIASNVEQLQLTNEITARQKLYTDLQSENVRMQSELAGKTSNKNVQEYAEHVLGMHALNPSQVEYIEIQTADVVEIPEEEQNIFVRIKNAFDDFAAYMRG